MKNNILIKYHNLKMLSTIDLGMLLEILAATCGDSFAVDFKLMNDDERKRSSTVDNGIVRVTERFWLFMRDHDGNLLRRNDLENRIVKKGKK